MATPNQKKNSMKRRKALTPLGETEMEVLHHVWELGEATVADVLEQILESRKVAYTTIMTVMRNLAGKGYLKFIEVWVSYVYSAAIQPDEVRYSLIDGLVDKVFHGSEESLDQTLVKSEKRTPEERENNRVMIEGM